MCAMSKSKVMLIDVAICNGCMSCVVACKDEHVENDWSPYAKPQPEYGQFWIRVEGEDRGKVPKVRRTYTPIMCMHCENAPCMAACPTTAIYRRDDGAVIIDPAKCDGCRGVGTDPLCMGACPYGVIYFNEELKIAQKCTWCAHLLDNGWKEPRCADACPTEAIKFGDEDDPEIQELLKKAEPLHPEYGTRPKVLYLNLPRPFIAGDVLDPEGREAVVGAEVTATDLVTGDVRSTITDDLGSFWLKDLERGHRYLVKVKAEGYGEKIVGVYSTEKDVNVGEVRLSSKQR